MEPVTDNAIVSCIFNSILIPVTIDTPGKPISISRKRSHASPDSDEENIAPVPESTKRSRHSDDEDVSKSPITKVPRFILNPVENTTTPRPKSMSKKPSTPVSAPVRRLAGRSPTRKVGNAFSRRSSRAAAATPYKRIDPPLRTKGQTCPAPFSLAEALRGPATTQPKSWQFEIHVDSEQQEMANLMEHSTCVLDISDDEGKSQNANDGRGKENIPPSDSASIQSGPIAIASSRKDMMTDEPRTPLGELNPTDFCPDGLDSTSCIVYDEDEKCPSSKDQVVEPAKAVEPTDATTTEPSLLTTSTISALIQSTAPVVEAEQQQQQESSVIDAATVPLPTDSEIEIWESGSATEEAAATTTTTESIFS